MKGPGILWMLQTAAGLSMAGPMFFLAFEYLRTGRLVGGLGFLALGAFALYLPTYLVDRFTGRVKRIGGPRTWVRRRIGRSETPTAEDETDGSHADADTEADPDADGETDGARSSSNPLDRLRGR